MAEKEKLGNSEAEEAHARKYKPSVGGPSGPPSGPGVRRVRRDNKLLRMHRVPRTGLFVPFHELGPGWCKDAIGPNGMLTSTGISRGTMSQGGEVKEREGNVHDAQKGVTGQLWAAQ